MALSPFDWLLTARVLTNLARFLPDLRDPAAPRQELPAVLRKWSQDGPFEAEIHDLEWLRITVPQGDGPFPLLLMSGGAADNGTSYPTLTRFWATHGFIVAQPAHSDAFERYQQRFKTRAGAWRALVWDVWGLVLGDVEPWKRRKADLTDILDNWATLEAQIPSLAGQRDTTKIGAGGYSYGGHTVALLGGAGLWNRGRLWNLRDQRVQAVIAISGQPPAKTAPRRVWKSVVTPTLAITGERDRDVLGRDWRAKTEGFRHAPTGEHFLARIGNANHFALSGRLFEEGGDEFRDAQEVIYRAVAGLTLLFWSAFLKEDEAARQILQCGDFGEIAAFWRR